MKNCLSEEERLFVLSLYKQYERLIKNTIIYSLSSNSIYDIEDVLMKVFYIACYKIKTLKESPNPAGWLVNTTKNVVANQNRKFKTTSKHIYDDIFGLNYDSPSFEDALLNDLTYEAWMNQNAIESVVSLLNENEKTLYNLRFVEHKTITEISLYLNKNEGTVKTAICRLKKHIYDIVLSSKFEKKLLDNVTLKNKKHIFREEVNREVK